MKNLNNTIWLLAILSFALFSCTSASEEKSEKAFIITTTNIVKDLVTNLVGDSIEVKSLMRAGVDPHYYKTKKEDIYLLTNAELIVYNGFQLEGKMATVLKKMADQKDVIELAEGLHPDCTMAIDSLKNIYDPHFWFSTDAWIEATHHTANELKAKYPNWANSIASNEKKYVESIKKTYKECKAKIAELNEEQRVLITSHDAFNYFGKTFGFEVNGLQGISTLSESGVRDVTEMVNYIIEHEIKAVFVESSVSKKGLKSVVEGCQAKGHEISIGGELFSDALGEENKLEGTYTGMLWYNVNAIVEALK